MSAVLTPQQRLAVSRAELLAAMGYEGVHSQAAHPVEHDATSTAQARGPLGKMGARLGLPLLRAWWRRHPMSNVVALSTPLLEHYARRHPGRLIGYGAGTGALLAILKPWRLLSAATVVTLLLRTSDMSALMADLFARNRPPEREAP